MRQSTEIYINQKNENSYRYIVTPKNYLGIFYPNMTKPYLLQNINHICIIKKQIENNSVLVTFVDEELSNLRLDFSDRAEIDNFIEQITGYRE